MIFKRIKAFTLVETIVTLAIVCLLVLMPTLYVKNIKEQIILDSTTRQIRSTINKYLHRSTVEKKSYFLSYFDNNSSIQIMEPHQVSKVYLNLSNRGTISPRTITVKSGSKEKKIKIQMTWGRMVEE